MHLGQLLHGKPQADAPGALKHALAYEICSKVVFAGRRRRLFGRLVELAGVGAGDRVLDLGSGPGYLTALAAQAASPGGSAVGVDPSVPMVGQARCSRATANCSFEVGRAEALGAADGSFDVVVSSLAVHHIPEESRGRAYAEVFRVLRPGGRVLLADFRPPRGRLGRHLVGVTAGEVMRDNPVDRIAPMLAEAGFGSVSVSGVGGFLHCVRAVKPGDGG
ncbi:ubiquinone/menaquinone biosynthesis C-methylase UbiE [Saccharothrix tamanrassetensis]|uniref:Ubiquinone/menaquinone biosynthesis C-methylase UbiE n=1 Tax=Saccharothrix tamanrassetensis TaxID=1051531 RepID=A0A841C983_9PSEU|nr:class I SAM-dependent methyltransferase [Saccharothrix tamanrassetensis]MBB5953701.1 ubiquinone/menaquinone biosynthesis C-methylase UbiE [Saccharothrix tamanrassetensis]